MIYDSGIWKDELKSKIAALQKLLSKTPFTEQWLSQDEYDEVGDYSSSYTFFIEIQKFLFYSSVVIRKMLESGRLSDELRDSNYNTLLFTKKSAKSLTKMNFDGIDSEYDLSKKHCRQMTLRKLCDAFIHSFLFITDYNEKAEKLLSNSKSLSHIDIIDFVEIYINTDKSKDTEILLISLSDIIKIFKEVINDNVVYYYEDRVNKKIIRSRNSPPGSSSMSTRIDG
jgi:hypothetical protein